MKPEDRAQELELQEWEARQASGRLPEPTRESAKWCRMPGCGERIPDARRLAVPGVQFCAECQGHRERTRGRHVAN